jgi:hypothetical protein
MIKSCVLEVDCMISNLWSVSTLFSSMIAELGNTSLTLSFVLCHVWLSPSLSSRLTSPTLSRPRPSLTPSFSPPPCLPFSFTVSLPRSQSFTLQSHAHSPVPPSHLKLIDLPTNSHRSTNDPPGSQLADPCQSSKQ